MTNQVIPAEAVEAAAKVLYLEDHLWDEPWEAVAEAGKYRTNARIALEAAAPHLMAAAWDDGYAHGYKHGKADCMKLHEGLGGLHRKQGEEMNIAEFLEARIAEDEEVARGAAHQKVAGPFHGNWHPNSLLLANVERKDAIHIARHDPARALAECASKRAIIEQVSDVAWGGYAVRDVILSHLAAVYKDHPDYRQEWAK